MGRNYFQLDLSRKLQYSTKRDIQRDIIAAHSLNPNRKQHIHGFDNHFLQTLLFSSIAKIIIMTKESHNSSFNFILIINIWCFYLCRTVRCLANSSRELLRHCSISQQYTRGYDIALYQILLFILWIIYKMLYLNGMMREKI